ncbi:MAG TPA: hypothetical protein VMP01_18880 [Pirellulaceae bacterium]|nr:hypothetical protein [Pirellulaceae bacterium]
MSSHDLAGTVLRSLVTLGMVVVTVSWSSARTVPDKSNGLFYGGVACDSQGSFMTINCPPKPGEFNCNSDVYRCNMTGWKVKICNPNGGGDAPCNTNQNCADQNNDAFASVDCEPGL